MGEHVSHTVHFARLVTRHGIFALVEHHFRTLGEKGFEQRFAHILRFAFGIEQPEQSHDLAIRQQNRLVIDDRVHAARGCVLEARKITLYHRNRLGFLCVRGGVFLGPRLWYEG